jgi:hypothetical protein
MYACHDGTVVFQGSNQFKQSPVLSWASAGRVSRSEEMCNVLC